jgi:Fur family ferric uptake transcriptional regulator
MTSTHNIAPLLQAQGFRLTRQRRTILEAVLQQPGHFSVHTIYASVVQHDPAINLATVYRTLHRLQQAGMLRTLDAGQECLLFEVARAHVHHHLMCMVCGNEQEIDDQAVDVLRTYLLDRYNFAAEPQHLAIVGRCSTCQGRSD